MAGRPTTYTSELGARICDAILEGCTLRQIERQPGMPGRPTIPRWARDCPEFRDQYARAREVSAHVFADDVTDLARDVVAGKVPADAGRVKHVPAF